MSSQSPASSSTSRRHVITGALAVTLTLQTGGCATPRRLGAVPGNLTAQAETTVPNARFLPDRDPAPFAQEVLASYDRERAWLRSQGLADALPPASYLAISGGGGDGAYSAGLLNGWTQAGTRPTFKLVTGVSTGALIAPFAFLGSQYDPVLKEAYTRVRDRDIFKRRTMAALLFSDAMADTAPMRQLIDKYVTQELLDAIAAEYRKGRLLFVGTTNLDAREPVFWNMGAIAASSSPDSLQLFRKITLASAAIPGAFPPVMIDVTVNGVRYQEMHVDGGATRQVFMYPRRFHLGQVTHDMGATRARTVYIIRNSRLDPDWANVDRRLMSIVARSVSSLIQTQGMGDLNRMYLSATRDGVDFNLAYIPSNFNVPKTSDFDPNYMAPLFERGRQLAAAGYVWDKHPPGFGPATQAPSAGQAQNNAVTVATSKR